MLSRNKCAGLLFPAIFKQHPEHSGRLADSHLTSVKSLIVCLFKRLKEFLLVARIVIPLQLNAFCFQDQKFPVTFSAGDEIGIDVLPSPSVSFPVKETILK